MNLQELNKQYAKPGKIEFIKGNGELTIAKLTSKHATAEVCLYGAHVLSFKPNNQDDLLWLSEKSFWEPGKPIRGGIPVCFPYFGPHASDSNKPPHGFARLINWSVLETTVNANDECVLQLGLEANAETKAIWPFQFKAQITVVVGTQLNLSLSYTNTGNEPFTCSDALHTYFNIGSINDIKIKGLEGVRFYNGFEKEPTHVQTEKELLIVQEENRRYIDHSADCIIEDPILKRNIKVSKKNSSVTVVWNPWINCKNVADFTENSYQSFVCVEAVNAYDNSVSLLPGQSHTFSAIIRC